MAHLLLHNFCVPGTVLNSWHISRRSLLLTANETEALRGVSVNTRKICV